jgi:hypothetical protein
MFKTKDIEDYIPKPENPQVEKIKNNLLPSKNCTLI